MLNKMMKGAMFLIAMLASVEAFSGHIGHNFGFGKQHQYSTGFINKGFHSSKHGNKNKKGMQQKFKGLLSSKIPPRAKKPTKKQNLIVDFQMWQKKNGHKNSLLPVCSNNRGCLTNGKKPSVSVSEPGTISLLLLGIAGVVLARRLTPTA